MARRTAVRPTRATSIHHPLLVVLAVTLLPILACPSKLEMVHAFSPAIFGGESRRTEVAGPGQHPLSSQSRLTTTELGMARVRTNDRRPPSVLQKPPMNDEIAAGELRVMTPNSKGKDEALGVMSKAEALAKAREMGNLDLILINANSDPPVCKIADYSKYRYMQEKKAKEVKKNSKVTEVKEVKMSYKIDVHDYEVRRRNAVKFLKQGNRVKCSIQFRGREMQHDKLGYDLLEKLATDMDDVCVREGKPKREGRMLSIIVSPRPEVVKQINDNRRAEEKARKKQKDLAKEKKAAAAAAGFVGVGADGTSLDVGMDNDSGEEEEEDDDDDDDDDEDMLDLEADIESSLDDLFGSDDLADDLFS